MNIGSLKITAKHEAGISDIPRLLQSADLSIQNLILTSSFIKTEIRVCDRVFAHELCDSEPIIS